MNEIKAERERRSFHRLEAHLTNLGGSITKMLRHVEALSTITGISEKEEFGTSPRPGENTAHMESVLIDVMDFIHWVDTLNSMLERQISELIPEFYETKKEIMQ